jgi:hypothetical protein
VTPSKSNPDYRREPRPFSASTRTTSYFSSMGTLSLILSSITGGLGFARARISARPDWRSDSCKIACQPKWSDSLMNLQDIIRAVQKAPGVDADGNAGPQTWNAIYDRICPNAQQPAAPSSDKVEAHLESFSSYRPTRVPSRCQEFRPLYISATRRHSCSLRIRRHRKRCRSCDSNSRLVS